MNMRHIYKKIAQKHGITVAEVRRSIQTAIDFAYHKNEKTAEEIFAQNKVPTRGATPTAEEAITYTSQEIKKRNSYLKQNPDKSGLH